MARLRKKRKKQSKEIIKTSVLKIIVFLMIVGLNWPGFLAVGKTFAFFSNAEDSNTNFYQAGTLDFSIPSVPDFSPELMPTQTSSRTINLQNEGSLDFQYTVRVENANDILCNSLILDGQPLADFVSATTTFSDKSTWTFTAELMGEDEGLQNQTCNFDFVFSGWQTNFPDSNQGFIDEERIGNEIKSGKWIIDPGDVVINELMWMGSRGSLGWGGEWPEDEWIELRNTTPYLIDLGGWQITKKTLSGEELMLEIPSGTIPAHGFFLISNFDKNNSRINIDPDLMDSSVDLRNKNLQVKLYKGIWLDQDNLIDTADDGNGRPLAGFRFLGFLHFSMERNDIPGDGTLGSSWHTCWDDSAEMRAYWDPFIILRSSINRGTPGGKNLSDYDEAELIEYYQQLEEEWFAKGLFVPNSIYEEENYDEEEIIDSLIDSTETTTSAEEETIIQSEEEGGEEEGEEIAEEPSEDSQEGDTEAGDGEEPSEEEPATEEDSSPEEGSVTDEDSVGEEDLADEEAPDGEETGGGEEISEGTTDEAITDGGDGSDEEAENTDAAPTTDSTEANESAGTGESSENSSDAQTGAQQPATLPGENSSNLGEAGESSGDGGDAGDGTGDSVSE